MTELVEQRLKALADPEKKAVFPSFFKTGPGQYGEGDRFIGVSVPDQRRIAGELEPRMELSDLRALLDSPWHECRQIALMAMIRKFEAAGKGGTTRHKPGTTGQDRAISLSPGTATPTGQAARQTQTIDQASLVNLYQESFARVNNWDLVDCSAPKLTGPWYLDRDRRPLFDWAASSHLWTQRISIMTTFAFIRAHDYSTTLALAELLRNHPHDLMHKAVGWMLREVGNRDPEAEREWLRPRYKTLPRTMLRYAIEKFPKEEYRAWLESRI